jgi:hypothetical protein
MNLKETIRRVLKEETKVNFFLRRVDLDKVKKILPVNAQEVFKFELTLRAVEAILWNKYNLGWEDLPEAEEIEFVTKVSDLLEEDIKLLYNKYSE